MTVLNNLAVSYQIRLHRLRIVLTWTAAVVAIMVALAIPGLFFATAYKYEDLSLNRTARDRADQLSEFIYQHPDMWQYSDHRLSQILRARPRNEQSNLMIGMIGLDGIVIASSHSSENFDILHKSHGLLLEGLSAVFEGTELVGTVHVSQSLWPILSNTGWISIFSVVLGLTIFTILRTLPLRALKERLSEMQENEQALQLKVTDLEQAHIKLKTQSRTLIQMTHDLRAARDTARAADHTKTNFLSSMSHELRTPLNAIIGFSETIINETYGPVENLRYREYTRDIFESGRHLLGLINEILDLSKVEAGKEDIKDDQIEVLVVTRAALKMVEPRAAQNEIELELDCPDGLPMICADERKLKQILVNVLSNAVKFTKAGGKVTIRTSWQENKGYTFQVIDNGIGIAPDDIAAVFTPFTQIDGELSRKYDGTGLGLSLTKSLMELHGGEITLESKIGRGTTVTLKFPVERTI